MQTLDQRIEEVLKKIAPWQPASLLDKKVLKSFSESLVQDLLPDFEHFQYCPSYQDPADEDCICATDYKNEGLQMIKQRASEMGLNLNNK